MPEVNPYQTPQEATKKPAVPAISGELVFEGRLSVDDAFVAGKLIATRWRVYGRGIFAFLVLVFLLMVYAETVRSFSGGSFQFNSGIGIVSLVFVPLIFTGFIMGYRALQQWRETQAYRRGEGNYFHIAGRVNDESIEVQKDEGSISWSWGDFVGFRSEENVVIMFLDTRVTYYLILSRTLFAGDGEWMQFQSVVWDRLKEI